jgi:hypothetical protein
LLIWFKPVICHQGGLDAAREYEKLADAFQKEIRPHIDHEMAKKVLNSNWLPGPPVLRRVPQK